MNNIQRKFYNSSYAKMLESSSTKKIVSAQSNFLNNFKAQEKILNNFKHRLPSNIIEISDMHKAIDLKLNKLYYHSAFKSLKNSLAYSQSIKRFYAKNLVSLQKSKQKYLHEYLAKSDFRINVVQQELEKVFEEEPDKSINNLLFKDISEPTNELESQLFNILDQQRKVLNDSINILAEINNTQAENIAEKPSNNKHDSPAFYENKMWYFEQMVSNTIGLIIVSIFEATVGLNPFNTLGFALLLGCLIRFIKPTS